jgi:hypothetical protein
MHLAKTHRCKKIALNALLLVGARDGVAAPAPRSLRQAT